MSNIFLIKQATNTDSPELRLVQAESITLPSGVIINYMVSQLVSSPEFYTSIIVETPNTRRTRVTTKEVL